MTIIFVSDYFDSDNIYHRPNIFRIWQKRDFVIVILF